MAYNHQPTNPTHFTTQGDPLPPEASVGPSTTPELIPTTQLSTEAEPSLNDSPEALEVTLEEKPNTFLSFIGITEKDVEITITKGNLAAIVKEVLIVSSLGGDVAPKHLPRLKQHPLTIKMVLPQSAADLYLDGTERGVEEEGVEYNTFVVSSVDPLTFIKEIIVAGKRGGLAKVGKTKFTADIYSSYILIKNVLTVGPNTRQLGQQVKYTANDLKEYNLFDLKLIGARYNVSHRGKANLIKMILDAQEAEAKLKEAQNAG